MIRLPSRSGIKPNINKDPLVCAKQSHVGGCDNRSIFFKKRDRGDSTGGGGIQSSLTVSLTNNGTGAGEVLSDDFWKRPESTTMASIGTSRMEPQFETFDDEHKQEHSISVNEILLATPEKHLLFNCKDQPILERKQNQAAFKKMGVLTMLKSSSVPLIPVSYAEFKREHGAVLSTHISYRAHRLNMLKIELEKSSLTVPQHIESPINVQISPIVRPRTSPASFSPKKNRSSQGNAVVI
jgi:hypothetical protein